MTEKRTMGEILEQLARDLEPVDDIHRAMAARMYGVPVERVTPEQRSRAKDSNYALA